MGFDLLSWVTITMMSSMTVHYFIHTLLCIGVQQISENRLLSSNCCCVLVRLLQSLKTFSDFEYRCPRFIPSRFMYRVDSTVQIFIDLIVQNPVCTVVLRFEFIPSRFVTCPVFHIPRFYVDLLLAHRVNKSMEKEKTIP